MFEGPSAWCREDVERWIRGAEKRMDANGTATRFSRFRPVSRQCRSVHVTSCDGGYVVCTFLPLCLFFALGRTACRIARLCMKSEWLSLQAEIPCNVVFLAESKWIEIWISPGPEILFLDVFLFLVDVVARIARVSCPCQSVISGHGTGFRVLMMGGIEQVPGFDETQDSGRKLQILWRNMKEKKNTWKHDKILMSRDVYSRDMSQRLIAPMRSLSLAFKTDLPRSPAVRIGEAEQPLSLRFQRALPWRLRPDWNHFVQSCALPCAELALTTLFDRMYLD